MNSSSRLAARRYAAAYDKLSVTEQEAAQRAADLLQAAGALKHVQELLTAPQIPLAQKKEALAAALKNWPQVKSFMEVLLEAKRYELLPQIVQEVQDLLDVRQCVLRARVDTAQPLSDAEQAKTQEVLSARYGKTVHAQFRQDSALLGGLKVWCNGELIDGSLQGQLMRLQEELTK